MKQLIKAHTLQDISKMRDYIIATTWSEIQIDCTDRVNALSDDQVLKEYNTLMYLSFWD